jgi:hypothetical protein
LRITRQRYYLIVLTGFVLLYTSAFSQTGDVKVVKGIISDSRSQDFLVGAHVFAQLAHQVAVSDQKGIFEIMAKPSDTLIVTSVGYERQIIPLVYFTETSIDLVVQMDAEIIELPGITIHGNLDVSYLHRKGRNPYDFHAYKPPRDHPDLDVPAGSLDYGPLSRWGKEAKEKRKLLKVYKDAGKERIYIQTVTSDSVRNVFKHMYGINEEQYNDFIIFLNAYQPLMDRQDKKDIVRVMHQSFLKFRPRRK